MNLRRLFLASFFVSVVAPGLFADLPPGAGEPTGNDADLANLKKQVRVLNQRLKAQESVGPLAELKHRLGEPLPDKLTIKVAEKLAQSYGLSLPLLTQEKLKGGMFEVFRCWKLNPASLGEQCSYNDVAKVEPSQTPLNQMVGLNEDLLRIKEADKVPKPLVSLTNPDRILGVLKNCEGYAMDFSEGFSFTRESAAAFDSIKVPAQFLGLEVADGKLLLHRRLPGDGSVDEKCTVCEGNKFVLKADTGNNAICK